jgi:hypothetical protein
MNFYPKKTVAAAFDFMRKNGNCGYAVEIGVALGIPSKAVKSRLRASINAGAISVEHVKGRHASLYRITLAYLNQPPPTPPLPPAPKPVPVRVVQRRPLPPNSIFQVAERMAL